MFGIRVDSFGTLCKEYETWIKLVQKLANVAVMIYNTCAGAPRSGRGCRHRRALRDVPLRLGEDEVREWKRGRVHGYHIPD